MKTNKWSTAATSGLLLALITIIIALVQAVIHPGKAVSLLLWVVKLTGSIYLLYYFIKEYSTSFDLFTYKDGFVYGTLVSIFSSLICACYLFLHYTVIFKEAIAEQIEYVLGILQNSNPQAVETFINMEGSLPQIITIVSLIYYTLFGVIASAIIANSTKRGDLFTA